MPAYNACAVAARGTDAPAFAGIGHKVVVSAVITPGTRKDAAFEVLAKGLAHVGARCVVVALAVELAYAGQFDGQGDHHTPRAYVRQAFRKYLECGIFAHG